MTLAVLVTLGGGASCGRCGGEPNKTSPDAAAPFASGSASAAPSPSASAAAARDAGPTISDASTSAADSVASDAGPSSCRLVYGPAEQPFRGPAAIVTTLTELRLVANDGGRPRIYPVPLAAPPPASASSIVPPRSSSFVGMRWPPCEIAGKWAYCQAAGGLVYRTTLGGADTKQIVKSRASTRIAAAPLGADHAVVATLDVRRTSEGDMLQAFVTLDDGETVRLSDDGAGATVVRLVGRGEGAVAMYLDARTAMVPVHARPLSMRGPALALGEDAVVFVGGPPERGVDLTPALAGSSLFALLPIARETTDFGMASISIADPPRDDVQPAWSFYPNGIDPAPIAATVATVATTATVAAASDRASSPDGGAGAAGGGAWVARVRPAEREPGSPRVLELGRLGASGAFHSLGVVATGKAITDMAIATDAYNAIWLLYGDANATWLERRVCP